MKKFLFALVFVFPFFFKLDSFASYHMSFIDTSTNRILPNTFAEADGFFALVYTDSIYVSPRHVKVYYFGNTSNVSYFNNGSVTTWSHQYVFNYDGAFSAWNWASIPEPYESYDLAYQGYLLWKSSQSSYDSSIKTLAFWHNSFSLLNDTWCTLSWSFPGVIKSKDYSSIYIDLFVNGSQVDVLHKGYPDLWDGALLDSTIFKYSDYGIKSGDNVKAVLTPYIDNNYGDDVIIEWKVPSGSHGGGGASRVDTTIEVPTNTPPSPIGNKPITTVITPEPIKVVVPSGETPTETTTVTPNGDTVTYQYDVTNNQYYYEYPYYVQNYYIDYSVPSTDSPDYTEEFQRIETYMNQLIAILTHIANTPPAPTPSGDTYYNNVSSGDTITNITNNYIYNYNYNFDFDIDFGDLTVEQQDLKSFIQDFPSFSEKYISFLTSFGVPVWLVILVVSCFGLIFVVLLIKIAKLLLPI